MKEEQVGVTSFEQKTVRRLWHKEEWYYSIVDILAVLTESSNPRVYWAQLKARAQTEGFDTTLAQIESLKLKSADGRFRQTEPLIGKRCFDSSNPFLLHELSPFASG